LRFIHDQEQFIDFLLESSMANDFVFLINFVGIDYDRLFEQISSGGSDAVRALWSIWVSTGLETADGGAKPALDKWDTYLALPLST